MKRTLQLISICILFIFISLYQLKVPALKAQDPLKKQTGFNFITRSKDILLDGNKEFRFIGLNTPNLHVEEDDRFLAKKWHRIDEYEIRDIFKTILVMGGSVTRTYVFSIQGGRNNPNLQSHIYAPGKYDEELFRDFDLVLKLANEYKIRLIVPFIDNWEHWGGTKQFTAFEGKTQAEFCTDQQVKNDFKNFIFYVLNRTNTYTGIKYKDDPAILAWETGNELRTVNSNGNETVLDQWTEEIAGYIKSIDKNHLVADGKDPDGAGLSQAQVTNLNTDMLTEHYYTGNYTEKCIKARSICKGKKVFYVGEFNNPDIEVHEKLFNEVLSDGITGALVWSLRYHTKDGGFYYHEDPNSSTNPCYRWPGFSTASKTNEAKKMEQIRFYAYQIQNLVIPALPVPEAPFIISESTPEQLRWRGSVGAESYKVERSTDPNGKWILVDPNAMEDGIPYVPFSDRTPLKGISYFYRVKAQNASGVSPSSNIIGPLSL